MRIYQAGPLFTEAEISWHKQFTKELERHGYDVMWPGAFFSAEDIVSLGKDAAKTIMETDRDAIDRADVVVALLDGAMVDDGTAWEIGYAYAKGKVIVGLRTDCRQGGDTPLSRVNAMIEASVTLVASREEVLALLEEHAKTFGILV
ncbi:MAG: nucleoside 2-deoxyribosyltransferase [Desulfovibrio sp.]|nr:nucleoside 2-deoxyribosyltransferase [Desulfovibrio sp.]